MSLAGAVHLGVVCWSRRVSATPKQTSSSPAAMACAMQRIAAILILFILLTAAPHYGQGSLLRPTGIQLKAEPLPLPSTDVQRAYGPLRLEGFWRLSSAVPAFGGISSLFVNEDGGFTGLDDSGEWATFRLDGPPNGVMAALPRTHEQAGEQRRIQDSESMTRDPATGRVWAGFEAKARICRYARGFVAVEGCVRPGAMQAWPEQGGAESLVRLGDGRFLAIGERANAPGGRLRRTALGPATRSIRARRRRSICAISGRPAIGRPTRSGWAVTSCWC